MTTGLSVVRDRAGIDFHSLKRRWVEAAQRRGTPLADLVVRKMVTASPIFCAHMILQGPPHAPFHGKILYGNFHLMLDEILVGQKRFAIMAPRGVGKSKMFSWAYPLWQAIRNLVPDGLLVASTITNAIRLLSEIRQEVETNPWLRWLLPSNRSRDWSQTLLRFSNGHVLRAGSMGSNLRGLHPAYIIGDDVLSDKAKTSETYRRQTTDFWFSVLEPMPIPGGVLGLVGTPMSQSDLIYRDLRHTAGYCHRSFPILDKQGRSVWPQYFPVKSIEAIRATTPASVFSTEYMLEPVTGESSMLPRHLMLEGGQQRADLVLGSDASSWSHMGLRYWMGVDLAFSEASDADFFAITVLGTDDAGNRYVAEMFRARGVPYLAQYNLVRQLAAKWRCERILVESNQAQRILPDELIRTTDLPVKRFVMTARKHDLVGGLPGLKLLAENRKWRLPMGGGAQAHLVGRLLDELESFTFLDGKVVSVGDHDDLAISCIAPGAMVTTATGPVPIEQVSVGDEVLTHAGRFRPVTEVMVRHHQGEAFAVAARGSPSFVITPEHPVYRAPAKLMPRAHRRAMPPLRPDPDGWGFVAARDLRAGRMLAGDFLLSPQPRWAAAPSSVEIAGSPVVLDEPLGLLFGLFLARGMIGGSARNTKTHPSAVSFRLVAEEEVAVGEFIVEQIARLDPGARPHWQKSRPRLSFVSEPLAHLFRPLDGAAEGERGLPMGWMGMALPLRLAMVRGWLVATATAQRNTHLRAITASALWAHQVAWTLVDAGLTPACRRDPPSPRKHKAQPPKLLWCVTLTNRDTKTLLDAMHPVESARFGHLNLTCRATAPTSRSLTGRHVVVKLGRRESVHYDGPVHNLEVEDDHSYVVEGVAVHNCYLANEAIKAHGFRFQQQPETTPVPNVQRQQMRLPARSGPGFRPHPPATRF